MALVTAHSFRDMNRVIEVDVVRQVGDAVPDNRVIIGKAATNRRDSDVAKPIASRWGWLARESDRAAQTLKCRFGGRGLRLAAGEQCGCS